MNIEDIRYDDIICGPKWPEPVKIIRVKNVGTNYVQVEGSFVRANNVVNDIISLSDLNSITRVDGAGDMTGDPSKVFLAIEEKRYRYLESYSSSTPPPK